MNEVSGHTPFQTRNPLPHFFRLPRPVTLLFSRFVGSLISDNASFRFRPVRPPVRPPCLCYFAPFHSTGLSASERAQPRGEEPSLSPTSGTLAPCLLTTSTPKPPPPSYRRPRPRAWPMPSKRPQPGFGKNGREKRPDEAEAEAEEGGEQGGFGRAPGPRLQQRSTKEQRLQAPSDWRRAGTSDEGTPSAYCVCVSCR